MTSSHRKGAKTTGLGMNRRVGLRYKLLLLLVIPLATAIFFAGLSFRTLLREYREISAALRVAEFTLHADRLMGGLQREMTLQLALLKRPDPSLAGALDRARGNTDVLAAQLIDEVEATEATAVSEELAEEISGWRQEINAMSAFRARLFSAGGATFSRDEIESRYVDWIDAAKTIAGSVYSYRDSEVGNTRVLVQFLTQAQEAGSAEQMEVLEALAGNAFTSSRAALVARARGVNEDAIRAFEGQLKDRPALAASLERELGKADKQTLHAAREDLSYHLQKLELLNKLKVLTGYGGLIDDFRNYVLRGDARDRDAFEQKSQAVNKLIGQMEKLPGYPETDAKLLARISSTFEEYGGYFELVTTLQETDTPVEIIDQSILVDDVTAQRALASLGDFHPRTSAFDWWQASSDSLAALQILREKLYLEINAHLQAVQKRAGTNLWIYATLLLFVVGIACALALSVLRRTVDGITRIVASMQELSQHGDLDIRLPQGRNDEIGALSVAMQELVQALGSIASQAEVIGEGDYRNEVEVRSERDRLALGFNRMVENTREVLEKAEAIAAGEDVSIRPRGENDQLGMALVRMSESLAAYEHRTRDEQWVNEGQIELANVSAIDEDEQGIGTRLIEQMAAYAEADAGIIWVWRAEHVEFLAGYGISELESESGSDPGDAGLVAQAVRDGKSRLITGVPEGYLRFGSGLGSALPTSILIAPLNVGSEVIGAAELAFFRAPDPRTQKFVETVRFTAGNALQRAQSRTRLQALLEKSRQQAEQLAKSEAEIQSRSDALLASNEELGEKTRLLESQASQLRANEEILRNQTEELQVINEELSERSRELEDRTAQIEKAKELVEQKAREVERASRYKSEFLANMSHELRTPLNSMLILSGMLADNEAGNLSDEDVESARIIHDSGNNLLNLINDILDLSKVEAGKVELNYERLRLPDFLEVMRRRYEPLANEKQLDFILELVAGAPEELVTDAMRFEQVITNLLSNALKFTAQGQVALRISLADHETFPEQSEPERYLSVAVSDTGIGIPADKVERVFNAFEQADGSTTREFGGTGLGLAISMRLANLMGGRVLVSSTEGKGSTFRLLVPLQPDAAQAGGHPAPQTQPSAAMPAAVVPAEDMPQRELAGQKLLDELPPSPIADDRVVLEPGDRPILVIDDDVNFLKILVSTVRGNGIRALAATDGETGLELIRRYRPCGVLLDVGLPDIDGWSVMERLRADPEIGDTPVHFISGHSEGARAEAIGAVGFATKPLTRGDIHSAIRRVLGDAAQGRKRVLLIDDHPHDRAEVALQLGAEGLEIEQVERVDDAFALLAGGSDFSCIIMDPQMQEKDGWQFLREASKADIYLPPLIFHTNLDLSDEQLDELHGQVVAVVLKNEASRQRLIDEATLFLHHVRRDPLSGEDGHTTQPDSQVGEADLGILKGKVVLVVDDDMRNVFALSKVLRGKGMRALKAPDGEKALRQLNDNADRVDIVLMDIMMPVMDGFDAIRELRKDDRFTELPVIALTAKAMKGDREACLQAGASDYQTKPVEVPELLNRMARLLAAPGE